MSFLLQGGWFLGFSKFSKMFPQKPADPVTPTTLQMFKSFLLTCASKSPSRCHKPLGSTGRMYTKSSPSLSATILISSSRYLTSTLQVGARPPFQGSIFQTEFTGTSLFITKSDNGGSPGTSLALVYWTCRRNFHQTDGWHGLSEAFYP